jgi:predicted aspartyl protease
MKDTRCTGLAIRVALFYFTLAGFCQSIQAQPEIRFRLVHNILIVVSVTADREGPFDFVLDTGADTTIVDPSLANKLALASLSHAQQTTLAGRQTVSVSSLDTVAAGAAQVKNLPVLVQNLGQLGQMDPHIEGILGQDFLSHFNYLLDYRRQSIRIESANEIRDAVEGVRIPMQVTESRMIVASEAQSRGHAKLHLLLDSGANSVVLLRNASQALNLPAHENRSELTSSGQIGLKVGRIHLLAIGTDQFHDLAVAVTSTEPPERIGDGLLPTVLFHALYVNNREGFVVFNPRVKKN